MLEHSLYLLLCRPYLLCDLLRPYPSSLIVSLSCCDDHVALPLSVPDSELLHCCVCSHAELQQASVCAPCRRDGKGSSLRYVADCTTYCVLCVYALDIYSKSPFQTSYSVVGTPEPKSRARCSHSTHIATSATISSFYPLDPHS